MKKFNCLILGGSGYIGSEIVRTLAPHCENIAFSFFENEEKAKELKSQFPNILFKQIDFQNSKNLQKDIQDIGEQWGSIDILIQAAGFGGSTELFNGDITENRENYLTKVSLEEWNKLININVTSTYTAIQSAFPYMRGSDVSKIIIINSLNAVKALPSPIHYAASAGALKGMVEAMAKTLGDHNIVINQIASGILEDGLTNNLSSELKDLYKKHCALEKLGQASDIAGQVKWLGLENTYMTGQTLTIDGGL